MKAILFLCLLGTCVPALASTPAEPLITNSSVVEQQLFLTLANLEQQRTLVTVTKLDSDYRHYTKLVRNHNGFSAVLDLDRLPRGRYVVTVKKGDTLRRQVILKTKAGLRCSAWK